MSNASKDRGRSFRFSALGVGGILLSPLLAGCALFGIETGYRGLSIKNHRFEYSEIEVPGGVPFVLTVDAIDDRDLIISAPDLGFTSMRIPASPASGSLRIPSRVLPTRYARLPLGPLQPGNYSIRCDCHGRESEAVIVVR